MPGKLEVGLLKANPLGSQKPKIEIQCFDESKINLLYVPLGFWAAKTMKCCTCCTCCEPSKGNATAPCLMVVGKSWEMYGNVQVSSFIQFPNPQMKHVVAELWCTTAKFAQFSASRVLCPMRCVHVDLMDASAQKVADSSAG